jgi:hypothetical protein
MAFQGKFMVCSLGKHYYQPGQVCIGFAPETDWTKRSGSDSGEKADRGPKTKNAAPQDLTSMAFSTSLFLAPDASAYILANIVILKVGFAYGVAV